MSRAAVHVGFNQPLELWDDVEAESPRSGELRVRLVASGVCHSDLSVHNMTMPLPPPMVLGHEGAGVIEEVGNGVDGFEVGDHVVLTFVPECQNCFYCDRDQGFLCEKGAAMTTGGVVDGSTRLTARGAPLKQMSMLGTFNEEAVVPAISAIKIDKDIPLKVAALLGCGVQTGVGAALNTANLAPNAAVAVIGCGGVGLNTIQGARIAGAERIIAIDMVESKLEMARHFGATDVVQAGEGVNTVAEVQRLTSGQGADATFEVIGFGPTIEQAMQMTRKGGETVLVGIPGFDLNLTLNPALSLIYSAKTVKGCWYGSTNAHRDVPKLIDLYRTRELKLDELISREIAIGEVNEAFEAMKQGEVARSVIIF